MRMMKFCLVPLILITGLSVAEASDADRDSLPDFVEDSVLGTGDGNGDGIADALQRRVGSFRWPDDPVLEGGKTTQGTMTDILLAIENDGGLTRVAPLTWADLRLDPLGTAKPVLLEGTGPALVLNYKLHNAGLPQGRFVWQSKARDFFSRPYYIQVAGSAVQDGDSFTLLIEDGGPQDLAKERNLIRAIGFPAQ